MKNSTSTFVQEVKARQQKNGDTFNPLAIEKKASDIIFNHLKGLGLAAFNANQAVTELQEKYNDVLYRTNDIIDARGYINDLRVAQLNLDTAKEELASIEEQIIYFENLKERMN
ncbi:hypothetical protein ABGT15_04395 [Flavobacterium enshiense]|uniref:hypothetical protein n=1 Tax=Flavobacterium enshiense TaxID=1341165 RepID=UPI00345D45D6